MRAEARKRQRAQLSIEVLESRRLLSGDVTVSLTDGDLVIVEDRRTAENGEMVIALLNGSDVTLKKLYREQGRVRLQPANPAMQPILVAPDQVQVQGVVIGVMRRY